MTEDMPSTRPPPREVQLAYANLLNIGMITGFIGLVVSFILYIFGIVPSYLPREDVPKYWAMSVQEYLEATNIPAGWGWLEFIHKGDFLNLAGIAFLSTITIVCYMRILPILLRQRDLIYSLIVILEVLVLTFATSGILTNSH